MNKYAQLRKRQQEEFNTLPLGFAFGDKQFEEMMEKWGMNAHKRSDLNKIYSIGYGGYIQKKDAEQLHQTRARHDAEMKAAIDGDVDGTGFIFDMFLYELKNHEYGYTWEIEETLDCLGYTEEQVNADPKLSRGFEAARDYIRNLED